MKIIVLVEEDSTSLNFYNNLLIGEEYQTISTLNGEDALKKLRISKADLILANPLSLKMSDLAFLSSVKKMSKYLPVIFISGKQGRKIEIEPQEFPNLYRILPLPVNKEDLLNSIYEVLLETSNLNMEQREFAECYIESIIEIGGSGVVYKGKLNKNKVAIKILPPVCIQEPHQLVRFQREFKFMQQLNHPNIINILKVGYEDNMPFIIMSYFPGKSIQKFLQIYNFLPLKETIEIILEVAKAMSITHQENIIHRDIKPSNILYNRSKKQIKIIDFGIAKSILEDQSITGKNQIVGTPEYMSPEQCQNQNLDAASDIYSLGISFYQMLTGNLPFHKGNPVRTMMAHLQDPVEWPIEPVQKIPLSLKNIIKKMLAKKRQDRYSNMEELAKILQDILNSDDTLIASQPGT